MSEGYGLNLTWEVVQANQRPTTFFSCSLLQCHLNGLSFMKHIMLEILFAASADVDSAVLR